LRAGKRAFRQSAEPACDDVERVLKRLVDSYEYGDARRVDCVVQVP